MIPHTLRAAAVRLILAMVLLVSPLLLPALLLWEGGRVHWVDLCEMYGWMWERMVRGYL